MNTTGVSERAPVVWSSPPPLAKSPPLSILCWQMLPVFIKVYRAFVAIRGVCFIKGRSQVGMSGRGQVQPHAPLQTGRWDDITVFARRVSNTTVSSEVRFHPDGLEQ